MFWSTLEKCLKWCSPVHRHVESWSVTGVQEGVKLTKLRQWIFSQLKDDIIFPWTNKDNLKDILLNQQKEILDSRRTLPQLTGLWKSFGLFCFQQVWDLNLDFKAQFQARCMKEFLVCMVRCTFISFFINNFLRIWNWQWDWLRPLVFLDM